MKMKICCAWILFVILLVLPASGHDISIRQANNEDDDHRSVLEQLRDRFVSFRHNVQYGVLYLAPPNAGVGDIIYAPDPPMNDLPRGVLYPAIDASAPPERFQHNFAVANVDFNGLVYGSLLERSYSIHTENLFVNLVYPRMLPWYIDHFGVEHPDFIYIFTHHLPCRFCDILIQNLQGLAQNARIFVGYTDLYLDREARAESDTQRLEAQARRDSLTNFLNDNNGRLFLLPNDQGACQQEGQSILPMPLKRSASESLTCPASTENREFIITMDFSTGKAAVEFYDIPADSYRWIGLFASAPTESYLTYEWTNEKTSGRKVFNTYLSDDMQVRYFNGYYQTDLAVTSYRWQQCGYDWTELQKLPYGQGSLVLKITDGKINVGFKCYGCNLNSWDWIAIQSMNQRDSQTDYWTWQWVSKFEGTDERWWKNGYRPNSDLSEGFRVKYIYATSGNYEWQGIYDNATPFWTINCRGTAL